MVVVATQPDEGAAEIAAGYLRHEGIKCIVVADPESLSLYGSASKATHRVLVPRRDAERARALLLRGTPPARGARLQAALIAAGAGALLLISLLGWLASQRR